MEDDVKKDGWGERLREQLRRLERYKYPILVLLLGAALLLIPWGGGETPAEAAPAAGTDLMDPTALEQKLDEEDFIKDPYILDVSSPGLGRQLRKEKDFQRSLGEKVECRLYKALDGQKEFDGVLKDFTEETVTLAADSGDIVIDRSDIAAIRLAIDF